MLLPSRTLAPVVRRTLGAELGVIPLGGHLVVDEYPAQLTEDLAEITPTLGLLNLLDMRPSRLVPLAIGLQA